ncbi:MAG: endonuclease/exonuclease/phosphatase family protein [Nitrososphaerota archaeon]
MSFEDLDPQTLNGIKTLRERIKIPSSKLDETVNIASWNIREFGRRVRTEAAIHYITEIISNFDLVALVELRENLSDLKRIMDLLGPDWRVIFSDTIMDKAGNEERVGYLYDRRALAFTGLAAEADPFRSLNKKSGEYIPNITWWRSPYIASFRAGKFDFVLITAHIRWGKSEKGRIAPLKMLAEWIDKRRESKYEDRDIILMGDFNIPQRDDELFKAITSKGLEIPDALLGAPGTNLAKEKRYDQILWYRNYKKTDDNTIVGGIADFYADDWRSLFPKDKYPNMTQRKFTYEISDHLPIWMQIDTTDDVKLDQIIQQ